ILILGNYWIQAQTPSPTQQEAYIEVFKLKVNTARQLLTQEKNTDFGVYIDNYADMLTLLVSDYRPLYDQLTLHQEQRLALLARIPDSSPYQRFLQAEVRLHWAFVKLKFGKEVSACWDIIKAYRLLEENAQKFPDFLPTYKSLGLLHVLIGATPQNYQWVARLLGLRGNINQGLKEIEKAQKDPIFATEAQLIELLVNAYVLQYSESKNQELLRLVEKHKDNLLIHFFGATVSMKDGRSEQALQFLQHCPSGGAYLAFPILEYLKGEIMLQKGEYASSRMYLKLFLSQYRGQNFLKDTYFKLFLSHWLADENSQAEPYLAQILKVGQATVEADKAAQKWVEKWLKGQITPQQKILMKARLSFDGGYLSAAWQGLKRYEEKDFEQTADKAEYRYRLGRIMQKQKQVEEAIQHYERAIELSRPQSLYFGATAALQLGYIYLSKSQKSKAIVYFKQALNYPKHEYKNSIDNKARAALTMLGVE
ncbi:MAG: tetratricopeptide repeat protein, partial [Runella sp.]